MTAYTERMPAGFLGDITRLGGSIIEPGIVGSADVAHGAPIKLSDGKFVALEEGDAATDIYGFMGRSFPTQGGTGTLTPGVVPAGAGCDVVRQGYVLVLLADGTAAKGGTVYVRTAADTGKAVGDIEAATATGNVAIDATFMGAADADGKVEISFNI
jgi:hypothetical protein